MGKGLLAWWRRRIVARGLAGAALFAVPVAVAAAIGFGSSLSGVAGGLSAVTNGPAAVPASAQTGPRNLNKTVVALSPKATPGNQGSHAGNGIGNGGSPSIRSSPVPSGTGTGTSGSSGGSGGSGGNSGISVPTVSTPSSPSVGLPGGGSSGDTSNQINDTVNNVIGGVNQTLNGLLGGN